MKKLIIPVIGALLLCACGFHLRGMVDVPTWIESVSILAQNNKTLSELLEAQLEGYKIKVANNPSEAKYWLELYPTTLQQQIISIGASTNPRQYQFTMTTQFLLKTRNGLIIKPLQQVVTTRQFTVNNDRILGSNEEESLLINEMHKDTAMQIINRLNKK